MTFLADGRQLVTENSVRIVAVAGTAPQGRSQPRRILAGPNGPPTA